MKTKETIKTEYKLMATKKTDPDTWIIKAVSETEAQAKRFMDILKETSNVYAQLKIETVITHQAVRVPKKQKTRT